MPSRSSPEASRSPPHGFTQLPASKWSERRSKSLQINRRRAPRPAATPQKPPPRPPAKPPESLKNRPKMDFKTNLPKFPQRGARSPRFGEGRKAPKPYVFQRFSLPDTPACSCVCIMSLSFRLQTSCLRRAPRAKPAACAECARNKKENTTSSTQSAWKKTATQRPPRGVGCAAPPA